MSSGAGAVSRRLPLLVAAALVGAACGPTGAVPPSSAPAPTSSLSPSPHGDTLTADPSIGYDGFREWATGSGWGGVAIAQIVQIGPLRWTTPDGTRPAESVLHGAPPDGQDHPGIGRVITVREIQTLTGRWLGPVDGATYFRPGGQLGLDVWKGEIPLPEFNVGQTVIAFFAPQEVYLGAGGLLPMQIGWLFPVDAAGRVQTLDPRENITLDTIASYLR